MTEIEQFELRLAAALRADTDHGVGRFDPAAIARAAIVVGRSRSLRGRLHSAVFADAVPVPRAYPLTGLLGRLAVAAVIGIVAVGLALYLIKLNPSIIGGPTPSPAASLSPSPSLLASPSAGPTSSAVQPGSAVFVFNQGSGTAAECGSSYPGPGCISRLWVANLDGTGAHELLPDQTGCQRFLAWSPDGARLLFARSECKATVDGMFGAERFYLTDASGSEPQLVDTGCATPCLSEDDAVFSSDGQQILFVRTKSIPPLPLATDPVNGKPAEATELRVLASMDLATGRVTELGVFDECGQCGSPETRSYPRWSPDRTQIVFFEETYVPRGPRPPADPAVFVADADGQNVHQVSEIGDDPAWSPDGARILFQGQRYTWTGTWYPGLVVRSSSDIYTVRPDGTDLRQLTTDGVSYLPAWSADGRIWFRTGQMDGPYQYWVMDADGSHLEQVSGPPQPQDLAGGATQPTP